MIVIRVPISIKGIIKDEHNQVLLVKNDRNEWELPGGRMELGETPEDTIVREIREELNVNCEVIRIVDSWMFEVLPDKYVFIVTYECKLLGSREIRISEEHLEYRWISAEDLGLIHIPDGYRKSVLKTFN